MGRHHSFLLILSLSIIPIIIAGCTPDLAEPRANGDTKISDELDRDVSDGDIFDSDRDTDDFDGADAYQQEDASQEDASDRDTDENPPDPPPTPLTTTIISSRQTQSLSGPPRAG